MRRQREPDFIQACGAQIDTIYKAGVAGATYRCRSSNGTAFQSGVALIVRIKDAAVEVTKEHAETRPARRNPAGPVVALTLLGIGRQPRPRSSSPRWRIARPLTAMTAAMRRLAGGDKSIDIPALSRADKSARWPARSRSSATTR